MHNLVKDIEAATGRKVDMTVSEHEAIGRFHEQEQSPLFSLLPRELRDQIWALTLAPYEDTANKFAENEYFYRPGHTARLKTDTTLLRTCRRIFLEANEMPMLQAEHSFYYYRAAPDARNKEWMQSLTKRNRQTFGHLHLYAQMFAIERLDPRPRQLRGFFLETPAEPGDFQPRLFHVTIRHTDWWFWEDEAPLRLKDRWVQAMLNSPDLRSTETFKLELETLDYKVDQLKPILDRLRKLESNAYETHLIDGIPTRTKFVLSSREQEYKWNGPANIDGNNYTPYAGMDTLKYYAVTLTWKLQFPEHPRAFVPVMRRQPRIIPQESRTFAWALPNQYHNDRRFRPATGLPYADGSSHAHAMRIWRSRQRKQSRKAEREGKEPPEPEDEAFALMHIVNKAVRYVSRLQAQDVEGQRWLEFGKLMGDLLPGKWQSQNSLLKFVEEEEQTEDGQQEQTE